MQTLTESERFFEMWDWVKKSEKFTSDAALLQALGYKSRSAIAEIKGGKPVSDKLLNALCDTYGVSRTYVKTGSLPKTNTDEHVRNVKVTGQQLQDSKAFGSDQDDEGLLYVPIGLQANYTRHFMEPVFINQLKRWKIPDFPYKGDKFRIFQIEGDSMTYEDETGTKQGLQNQMEIVAERVYPEDWDHTVQWYIHVIVFEDLLTIKRLYREKGNTSFVMIADNPDYGQRRVRKEDIKELWIMKRYLGWNVPPPRRIEITI